MQENIGMAIMSEIPCVIINAQRVGPSTGAATKPAQGDLMQARWGNHGGLSPIVLSASSVQECYDMTITAFNLAERFSTPVVLLTDGVIAHLTEQIVIPQEEDLGIVSRARPKRPPEQYQTYEPNENLVPEFGDFNTKHIIKVTSLIHNQKGLSSGEPSVINSLIRRLDNKIKNYLHELPPCKYYGEQEPDILFISYGISARSAMESARIINSNSELKAGCCQLATLWPLDFEQMKKYLDGVKYVVIPEMNLGLLSYDFIGICKEQTLLPINKYDGTPISPKEILEQLREVIKDDKFTL
jgi:2-oxoglutarate/2-oxoacid ferredoxin oxidoreductase subunit alpha